MISPFFLGKGVRGLGFRQQLPGRREVGGEVILWCLIAFLKPSPNAVV